MATIGSVLSYEDIVDLRNEGKSDDEIRAYAKAKLAYQNSPEYQAAKRLDDFHKNELKQAFDSGAKGVAIDALRARQNIQKANLIGGVSRDELQDAANSAQKLQEQAVKQERYKDANALERYYYGGVENVNGMIAGLAKMPMKAAEVLDKRINQYQKNIAQGKETETHAKNLASKVGGFLADSWRSEMFKNLYNDANDIAKDYKARNEAWEQERPDEWNLSRLAGEFVNDPLNLVGGKLIAQGAKQGFKKLGANALEGAAIGGVMSMPHASYHSENLSDFAKGVGLGAGVGAVVQPSLVWAGDKIANRAAKKKSNSGTNDNEISDSGSASAGGATPPPNAPNAQMGDSLIERLDNPNVATGGDWLNASTNAQKAQNPNSANIQPNTAHSPNTTLRPDEEQGAVFRNGLTETSQDIKGNGFVLQGERGALSAPKEPSTALTTQGSRELQSTAAKLKTADDADIIDLVPDENGVYSVAFNGSSKELTKIASEIGRGEAGSVGARKLLMLADSRANQAAEQAVRIISANIAKVNNEAIEFYADNTALPNELAKKYPMLSKNEVLELANKQIMENASPELLGYTRAINGGELPSDARLLGTNSGRMVAKSLELGATPAEVRDMLLKANIKGDLATALAKQLKSRDISAFNESIYASEQRLLNESVESVRTAARNENVGAILEAAKAKAIENDALLKKGVGNQSLVKTMDIEPNERIVSFDDGVSASYTPKQKEMRGVYNVAFNEKRATQIYKDIEDVENAIKFEKGRADNISANKDGFGSLHIQKHLDPKNEGYITTQEYLNMGEYIRKAGDFKESGGKRVYDYTDENGVRFRAIIGDTRGGKDRVISFFSDRKAGSAYDRQNYTRNQPLSGNSSANEIKSQGIKELTNAKSVLDDESKELLKQKAKAKNGDFSGADDAKARLMLDKHRAKADNIAKEKGINSAEYKEAKAFADDFEQLWFEKDGSPKLVPSSCRG